MTLNGDPYRILGLPAGAPLTEVKRAYRRLAKAHHPDTAGDAATQRFLVIQAAYEALVGSDGRGRRQPGTARPAPWTGDRDRAHATRDNWSRGGARAGRRPGEPGASSDPGGEADPDPDAARRRRRAGTRRASADRPPDRATPGSTSYDFAEGDAFDPAWSGASWYGQSSGTYWTINPKEYADPRKHGPEYQARGRRRDEPGPPIAEPPAEPGTAFERDARSEPDAPPRPDGSAREAASRAPRPPRPPRAAAPPPPRSSAGAAPPPASGGTAPTPAGAGSRATAVPWPVRPTGRIGLALIGWPPVGLALALAIGELTGCGRFSAGCVEVFSVGGWILQVALIGALIVVPPLAGIAAAGTVAVLAASVPAAVVLSAAGGSRQPDAAGGLLLAALAVAWASGIGLAVVRRARTVPP